MFIYPIKSNPRNRSIARGVTIMPIPFDMINNIGFISTRFAGTDGVSLETEKWARVFEKEGLGCFYFAGELDRPPSHSHLVPIAHFLDPDIRSIFNAAFSSRANGVRTRQLTTQIHSIKEHLKDELYDFISKFKINLLISENALTIPLNIPLGLAITEVIAETGLPTIAHHHDFFWERHPERRPAQGRHGRNQLCARKKVLFLRGASRQIDEPDGVGGFSGHGRFFGTFTNSGKPV
jgi:hypothetical protein